MLSVTRECSIGGPRSAHLFSCRLSLPALAAIALLGAWVAAAPEAAAKTPAAWTGRVVEVADADTLWISRGKERVKVRLHWADAPEVAKSKKAAGQAAGVAAREFIEKRWLGELVHVEPRSMSFDRVVADVDCDGTQLGFQLVAAGYAWLDPRYKPPAAWLNAQSQATKAGRGLWDEKKYGKPVPPWDWRKGRREVERVN